MAPHQESFMRIQESIDAISELEQDSHTLAPTFEERAEQIAFACRGAAAVLRDRRLAGIADPEPDPWPESTWEFLARHARRFH
jgi:hypothetical protein